MIEDGVQVEDKMVRAVRLDHVRRVPSAAPLHRQIECRFGAV